MNFIFGIIIIFAGLPIVLKSEAMLNNFGRIAFFEHYLGLEGGSRLGYKLLGMLIIFIGVLFMTGMIGGFVEWIMSPIMNAGIPG
jgi:hypothetical protein